MPHVSENATAQRAFALGYTCWQHFKYRTALRYFSEALTSDPNNADVYQHKASCEFKLNQIDAALTDLNKAIAIRPKKADYYANRSEIYFDQGQNEKAVADAEKACALAPNSPVWLFSRAKILEAVGEYQRAVKDYDRAITLAPDEPYLHFYRANLLMRFGKYEQALEDFTENINHPDADDVETSYTNRAKCYDKLGRHDLAEQDRKKARELTQSGWGAFMQAEKKKEHP